MIWPGRKILNIGTKHPKKQEISKIPRKFQLTDRPTDPSFEETSDAKYKYFQWRPKDTLKGDKLSQGLSFAIGVN